MNIGIYLHIPFCKQRCIYCDFVSSTDIACQSLVIDAMIKEIDQLQVSSLSTTATLYLGGGTPSIVEVSEIERLLLAVKSRITLPFVETTIEVNPDDVTLEYLQALRHIGIDRVSIGIQSFADKDLEFLNRRHSSLQAKQSVLTAHRAGFNNISIDLMYGLPQQSVVNFRDNLRVLSDLPINHFSAYHLSVERNTPLYQKYINQEIILPTEEESVQQFYELQTFAANQGFIHYEISNFCKPECYAVHNSSYWKDYPYIGIGVGAHGYDGKNIRLENPSEISFYLKMIEDRNFKYRIEEKLTPHNKFNELLFIGLRTLFGVDLHLLYALLSSSEIIAFNQKLKLCESNQHIKMKDNILTIPPKHWFIADTIIRDLML